MAVISTTRRARFASQLTAAARSGATAQRWASSTIEQIPAHGLQASEHFRPLREIDRGHRRRQLLPRSDVRRGSLEAAHRRPIDDRRRDPEPNVEFFQPLRAKTRRAEDERTGRFVTSEKVDKDEPRLDGLAKTDLVGEQQAGSAV